MDYDLELVLVPLVAHRRFEGGTETNVTRFANDLFDRFDIRIVAAAAKAGKTLDARQRTVVASIAAFIGGTAEDAAQDAVTTYIDLFAN
jgi:hypothetical protein